MSIIEWTWWVLTSLTDFIKDWLNRQLANEDNLQKMKLEKFIPWFESTLLKKAKPNFAMISSLIADLDGNIVKLNNVAKECCNNNNNMPNRIQRICDQIDLLCKEHYQGKRCSNTQAALYPHNSLLPDSEYIREVVSRIKSKLKVIEDISVSKKPDAAKLKGRGDNGKRPFELPFALKEAVRRVGMTADALELESVSKAPLLNYFNEVKQVVHRPFYQIRLVISELPSINTAKQQLVAETDGYRLAYEAYSEARSVGLLQDLVKLRLEVGEIERVTNDMFKVVREFVDNKDCLSLLETEPSEQQRGPESLATNNATAQALATRLAKYSKFSIGDLLHVAKLTDQAGHSPFVATMADVKSRLLLSSNRVAEDDSELRGVVQAVVEFDAGLFVAYCAAWNERILNLSQAIKSEEFTKAYNTLVAARSAILKARGQYEKALHQYSATFEQHREATQQTEQLKDRLREVALTELFEEVVFVQ